MTEDRLNGLYDELRETGAEAVETGKKYSGLVTGTALEATGKLTDVPVFGEYIDPWNGDKLVHAWFSKDLSKAAWNGTDRIGEYLEESNRDRVSSAGEALQDPYTKTAMAFGAVSAFTGLKELWYDADPDGLDAAANYAGMSYHMLQAHHDIDPLRPAKDLYGDVKEEIGDRYTATD